MIKENNRKCLRLLLLVISFICLANGRQIRYSRYNTEVIDDSGDNQNSTNATNNQTINNENEVEATVREIKLAPYPASGFRPSKTFPLPKEATAQNVENDIKVQITEEESAIASTTEIIDLSTTTQGYESETTTTSNMEEENFNEVNSTKVGIGGDVLAKTETSKASYPPAGFQPRIPFLLPTDNLIKNEQQQQQDNSELPDETKVEAPYAAAGYRLSKPFLLPSEQLKLEDEHKMDVNTKNDNSNHPVCGSSTNPLAPKPLEGEKEDPDSESINVNAPTQQKYQ